MIKFRGFTKHFAVLMMAVVVGLMVIPAMLPIQAQLGTAVPPAATVTPGFATAVATAVVTPVFGTAVPSVVISPQEIADANLIPADLAQDLIDQAGEGSRTIIGWGLAALVALLLPVIYSLYNSTPAWRGTIKAGGVELVKLAEGTVGTLKDAAATNDIDWDDPFWQTFYDSVKAGRIKLEHLSDTGQSS